MSNTSEINVYYRREDIQSYNTLNTLNFIQLFSDFIY